MKLQPYSTLTKYEKSQRINIALRGLFALLAVLFYIGCYLYF